jgi:WD40 repeat protein
VWDAATLQETRHLDGYVSEVLTGAWRADGQLLATGDATAGTVQLWDLSTDTPRRQNLAVTPPNVRWLHALAFTPEGRHLAVGHPAGMVLVLRLAKRGEVFRVPAGP